MRSQPDQHNKLNYWMSFCSDNNQPRIIPFTETLIIPNITKTESNNYNCFEKHTVARNTF